MGFGKQSNNPWAVKYGNMFQLSVKGYFLKKYIEKLTATIRAKF